MHIHFQTLEEIYQVPGFKADNPIRPDVYAGLIGWYDFAPGTELACCVQKPSGTLCKTTHRKGWVARLADESATVIGGDCATDKFGADSVISTDIAVAENKLAEMRRLERLRALVGDRPAMRKWCREAVEQLQGIKLRIEAILEGVGPAAPNLEAMARTGNGAVSILGVRPAKRDPKDGKVLEDAQQFRIPMGRLRNVEACNRHRTGEIRARVNNLQGWCRKADEELLKLRGKKLTEAAAVFADFSRLQRELVEHQELLTAFEANDFTPLAFVLKEFSDRAKVARFARNRLHISGGKDAAKDWLMAREQALKDQHGVARLVFG